MRKFISLKIGYRFQVTALILALILALIPDAFPNRFAPLAKRPAIGYM